ncbi:MAG: 6-carboxytetrahydropterin synthase [Tidjanibacter sp.]|nr:6-carboxytetrahydropterin synthase [Tidjanibacter sp.]
MNSLLLTKEFSFEMAHTLTGYDGACREIHGHSYRLSVTVEGTPCDDSSNPKLGMAVDFGDLKRIVNTEVVSRYDHAFVLRRSPETEEIIEVLSRHFTKIEANEWQPTCENLVRHFAKLIAPALPEGIKLHSLRLYETATSSAELIL